MRDNQRFGMVLLISVRPVRQQRGLAHTAFTADDEGDSSVGSRVFVEMHEVFLLGLVHSAESASISEMPETLAIKGRELASLGVFDIDVLVQVFLNKFVNASRSNVHSRWVFALVNVLCKMVIYFFALWFLFNLTLQLLKLLVFLRAFTGVQFPLVQRQRFRVIRVSQIKPCSFLYNMLIS